MFAPGSGRLVGAAAALVAVYAVAGALRLFPPNLLYLVFLVAAVGLLVFLASFFRDPERAPGDGIVAAADGRVQAVEPEGRRVRISVFMNVTDVHVNRLPLDGRVVGVGTAGAGHVPAYRADAAQNVARTYTLDTAIGRVEVTQVTGVLARRLVSFVAPGDVRRKGERFGMIILGSRVDVVLPADRVTVTVSPGDRTVAGRTTIARERS